MPWKPSKPGERPTLGRAVLLWIRDHLKVVDGPAAGEPLILTREQAQFVLELYEVDPKFDGGAIAGRTINNGRIIRRAVLSRPKGWGKSPLVAALCLVEAFGPVVHDGWDAHGQPVGRPWVSTGIKPKVQIVAVSEDQTANTWEPCLDMVRNSPKLLSEHNIEPLETFISFPRGRIEAATSAGLSREGFRPVFTAMDQTESWTPTNGGRKLASTIRRNLAKVNGCSVETPNAYLPGENSVAENSWKAFEAQREGQAKSSGLLFDHREALPDVDPENYDSLRAGLRHAYGESASDNGGWVNLDRIIAEYWDADTDPQDARRYYLNQITHASDAWVTSPAWGACAAADAIVRDGDTITLGFDGSKGRLTGKADATALIGCRVRDGHLFEIGDRSVWEPPRREMTRRQREETGVQTFWTPPVAEVEATVALAFRKYNVVGFYADPSLWTEVIAKWEYRYGSRLKVKASQRQPISAWPTGKHTAAILAVATLGSAIENGACTHDGSAALTRHVLNARRRATRTGYLLYKAHPESPDKIDAAYAAVMAWKARLDALSAGLGARRGKPVIGRVRGGVLG
jgi:hypothetical protein